MCLLPLFTQHPSLKSRQPHLRECGRRVFKAFLIKDSGSSKIFNGFLVVGMIHPLVQALRKASYALGYVEGSNPVYKHGMTSG